MDPIVKGWPASPSDSPLLCFVSNRVTISFIRVRSGSWLWTLAFPVCLHTPERIQHRHWARCMLLMCQELTRLFSQVGPGFHFRCMQSVRTWHFIIPPFMICKISMVRIISLVVFASVWNTAPHTQSKDDLFSAQKLCNCGGLGAWTRPTLCPEAGPSLSCPGHNVDKKRKGQRAKRNSVYGSGQQCEKAGLKGREGEQE